MAEAEGVPLAHGVDTRILLVLVHVLEGLFLAGLLEVGLEAGLSVEVVFDGLLTRAVTNRTSSMPASVASRTMYSIEGRSTTGSISLGTDFVMGRKRVPRRPRGQRRALQAGFSLTYCKGSEETTEEGDDGHKNNSPRGDSRSPQGSPRCRRDRHHHTPLQN